MVTIRELDPQERILAPKIEMSRLIALNYVFSSLDVSASIRYEAGDFLTE